MNEMFSPTLSQGKAWNDVLRRPVKRLKSEPMMMPSCWNQLPLIE